MLKQIHNPNRKAFTLVELLVVVSLLAILTAYLVPQLRTINKDRNIREAARVVGSFFTQAIQRAKTDGSAGILIERNPRYIDPNAPQSTNALATNAQYAGTTMYLLRHVPAFSGDGIGTDNAMVALASPTTLEITIPRPYEHDEFSGRRVIQVNDHIYLNNRNFGYRIIRVEEIPPGPPPLDYFRLRLTVALDSYPAPPLGLNLPYIVKRQPRKVESSRTIVPKGHMIDLRMSGDFDPSFGFEEMFFTKTNEPIKILFDEDGRFDRIHFGNEITTFGATNETNPLQYVPNGSLYLLITQDDLDISAGQDQLMDEANLWVTVSDRSGNVNVANIAPQTAPSAVPMPTLEFVTRLSASRVLSRSKKSAEQ